MGKSEVGETPVNINYYMLASKDLVTCPIFLHNGDKITQVFKGWRHNKRMALAPNSNINICTGLHGHKELRLCVWDDLMVTIGSQVQPDQPTFFIWARDELEVIIIVTLIVLSEVKTFVQHPLLALMPPHATTALQVVATRRAAQPPAMVRPGGVPQRTHNSHPIVVGWINPGRGTAHGFHPNFCWGWRG
jgi:hypothetical protein